MHSVNQKASTLKRPATAAQQKESHCSGPVINSSGPPEPTIIECKPKQG